MMYLFYFSNYRQREPTGGETPPPTCTMSANRRFLILVATVVVIVFSTTITAADKHPDNPKSTTVGSARSKAIPLQLNSRGILVEPKILTAKRQQSRPTAAAVKDVAKDAAKKTKKVTLEVKKNEVGVVKPEIAPKKGTSIKLFQMLP